MSHRRQRRRRRNLTGVDYVAIILATGVAFLVVLILIATIIQILHNAPGVPEIQLSENSTQILIAAIGGILGVLGGYIGYQMKGNHMDEEQRPFDQEQGPTPPGQGAPPPSQPVQAPDTTPPEGDPAENDDKTDVQPRPEPKEGQEGDPHGSPLDDPEDEKFVRGNDLDALKD